jgi:predicted  nucleic acid-binding Zn-ribbon protein
MEKKIILEDNIKTILDRIINEEVSKVKRDEFARVQFKIDELQNSLNETVKELRKLQDSVPGGLKTVANGRINGISQNLTSAQKLITQLKEKIKLYKKTLYSQQIDEKKK